jgi:CubicO group peptidase (beta-lactamase class C family)
MLVQMMERVRKNQYAIDSITIIRNGYIVMDAYFYPFRKEMKRCIHSCTKSIVSALVGIAIDRGYIKNVNQPVLELLPEMSIASPSKSKQEITVKHLLTMTSGLRCRDSYLYHWEGMWEMQKSKDWARYVLTLPMAEIPGEFFEYCNSTSYLLSAILQKKTNMSTLSFAEKHLFKPIGITDVTWRKSPQGINIGWGEMWLTPHDMAKIGWLYLNKGKWNGEQIISQAWVERSTRGDIKGTLFNQYGYQWWIDSSAYYMAVGYLGQYLFVVPEKNMVVVFTGDLIGGDFFVPKKLLDEYIIPAASPQGPLAPYPAENKRLDSMLKSFSKAPEKGIIWLSEEEGVAKEGVFIRKANPAFTFEFPIGSRKSQTDRTNQIMAMKTPDGVRFQASVCNIPKNIALEDFGPKVYAKRLKRMDPNAAISNKAIQLKDGTPAYRTEIKWLWLDAIPLTTILVSAFQEDKCVFLAVHPWQYPEEVSPIVESLSFNQATR